jgi:hypothetical protein
MPPFAAPMRSRFALQQKIRRTAARLIPSCAKA